MPSLQQISHFIEWVAGLVPWLTKSLGVLLAAYVTALIGYYFGRVRYFREEKQRIYTEVLPVLVKWAYDPSERDNKEFNSALARIWLYANKDVAKSADKVVAQLLKSSPGNATKTLQQTIVAMRRDIQPFYWQRLKAEDVQHLYLRVTGGEQTNTSR